MKDIDKELDKILCGLDNYKIMFDDFTPKEHYALNPDLKEAKQAIKQLINQANTPTHIMGKPIDEVYAILTGLEMERLAEMQLTMANLKEWQRLLAEEQKKTFEKVISRQFEELKGE